MFNLIRKNTKSIPVTMDKSHLITIGERMYSQSLELIRELVSNAYDADATEVRIELTPYTLKVKDNGSGMDEGDVRQYFNIGSSEKRTNKKSPRFNRTRIGEFGIGKFASFSACDVFSISTQKGNYAATFTFDKNLWQAIEEWEIPITEVTANPLRGNGVTVTLEGLKKILTLPDIERFIRERIPLQAAHFKVYLNGKVVEARIIPGKKFPIHQKTSYGLIHGDIVIPNLPLKSDEERGIECYVNEVFITRELFGLESTHAFGLNRLTGRVHADFLKITSDRSRFITDEPAYLEFEKVMRQELQSILKQLKAHAHSKEDEKADGLLKDALSHIRKALKKHPEFAPETQAPVAEKDQRTIDEIIEENEELVEGNVAAEKPDLMTDRDKDEISEDSDEEISGIQKEETKVIQKKPIDRSSQKIKVKTLSGKEVSARRMKIGDFSIVCRTEQLGENESPVLWDSGIIFINRDHPVYKRFQKNAEALTLLITELIAQEVARLRSKTANEAFTLQNQIIRDAWG